MSKTDHWRTAYKGEPEGPLPYVETEEAFDRVQAGPKITREAFEKVVSKIDAQAAEIEKLKKQTAPGGEVTQVQLKAAIETAGEATKKAQEKANAAEAHAKKNETTGTDNAKAIREISHEVAQNGGWIAQVGETHTAAIKKNAADLVAQTNKLTELKNAVDKRVTAVEGTVKKNDTAITNLTAAQTKLTKDLTDAKTAINKKLTDLETGDAKKADLDSLTTRVKAIEKSLGG